MSKENNEERSEVITTYVILIILLVVAYNLSCGGSGEYIRESIKEVFRELF